MELRTLRGRPVRKGMAACSTDRIWEEHHEGPETKCRPGKKHCDTRDQQRGASSNSRVDEGMERKTWGVGLGAWDAPEGDRALEGSDSLTAARETARKKSWPLCHHLLWCWGRGLPLAKVSAQRDSFPCPELRKVLNLWAGGVGLGKSRAQELVMPCASVQCYGSDMPPPKASMLETGSLVW